MHRVCQLSQRLVELARSLESPTLASWRKIARSQRIDGRADPDPLAARGARLALEVSGAPMFRMTFVLKGTQPLTAPSRSLVAENDHATSYAMAVGGDERAQPGGGALEPPPACPNPHPAGGCSRDVPSGPETGAPAPASLARAEIRSLGGKYARSRTDSLARAIGPAARR